MVRTDEIALSSPAGYHIEDITSEVAARVADSGLRDGIVTLFVVGSTAGLSTVEYEPGLVADLRELFQRIAPEGVPCQ